MYNCEWPTSKGRGFGGWVKGLTGEYNMDLRQTDKLMQDTGANLDFLLLLEEYLQTYHLSLDHLTEWITRNEYEDM